MGVSPNPLIAGINIVLHLSCPLTLLILVILLVILLRRR